MVSLTDYGAFIELEPGIEGLVHVSEMTWTKRVKHPTKIVNIGDTVEGRRARHRPAAEAHLARHEAARAQSLDAAHREVPGRRGHQGRGPQHHRLRHLRGCRRGHRRPRARLRLSWTQRVKHPSELFKKGDEVEAVVLNIDVENERFSLGIKQLTDDPWDTLPKKLSRAARRSRARSSRSSTSARSSRSSRASTASATSPSSSEERVDKTQDVVKAGDEVEVMVLDVDPGERRISLSIKAAREGTSDYRAYMQDERSRSQFGDVLGGKLAGLAPTREERK